MKEVYTMTTATVNGKRITMTIEEKARLLTVIDIHEEGHMAVTSGSVPTDAYVLRHDGYRSQYCPCGAYTTRCAHRAALDWYLEEMREEVERAATFLSLKQWVQGLHETARANREMFFDSRFQ
jgi:hypothetical protein